MAAKKKGSGGGSGSGNALRNVASSVSAEALIDLVERLGVVDLVVGRVKAKIEETDVDELFDEVGDYLKRNPEVLVVSLGAITIASATLVWLNSRREWDGTERRESQLTTAPATTTTTGRARKAS